MECLWGITYTRPLRYSQFLMKSSGIRFTFPITTSHQTSSCALLVSWKSTLRYSFFLGRCHTIYNQLFFDELKVTELGKMHLPTTRTIIILTSPSEHAISEFMQSFGASFPSSSISLKMHLLEDHTVTWA